MTNFEFLQKYEQLQYTIMFDKFINLDFAVISFCQGDDSSFWNHALTNQIFDRKQLSKIEKAMNSRKRQPAVYFENKKSLQSLIDFLKKNSYKFDYEDSWMFWKDLKIDESRFGQVRKVTTQEKLKIFLKVFDACYQKNDPQNPYGELGDYLNVAEKVWHRHYRSNRLEYFLVYQKNRPVAVSTLINYEGIGYISNVGSLRDLRGQGFGKLATLYCVRQSEKHGNTTHCLATEENTFPNEFYKRIGFQTRFTAVCYKKAGS